MYELLLLSHGILTNFPEFIYPSVLCSFEWPQQVMHSFFFFNNVAIGKNLIGTVLKSLEVSRDTDSKNIRTIKYLSDHLLQLPLIEAETEIQNNDSLIMVIMV